MSAAQELDLILQQLAAVVQALEAFKTALAQRDADNAAALQATATKLIELANKLDPPAPAGN